MACLHRPGWPKKGTDIPCLVFTPWLQLIDRLNMDIVEKAVTVYIVLGMNGTDMTGDN